MKISGIKNLLALNLLSLLGYVCFVPTLLFCSFVIPTVRQMNYQLHDSGFELFSVYASKIVVFYFWCLIIAFGLIILAIVEFILKKQGKCLKINTSTLPFLMIKIYPYILWSGIFFAFIPIYWLILLYALPAIVSLF